MTRLRSILAAALLLLVSAQAFALVPRTVVAELVSATW
jgi:hypothetical protein